MPVKRNTGRTVFGVILCALLLSAFVPAQGQTPAFRSVLVPDNPRPGEPVTVWIALPDAQAVPPASAALTAGGKRLSSGVFFAVPGNGGESLMAALFTVPATAVPGAAAVQLLKDGLVLAEISLVIAGRDFVSEVIELNQTLTNIRTVPDPQKTAESERLWAILSRTGTDIYGNGRFVPPVTSTRRTSFFGDRRVFKYVNGKQDTSIHAGVDYGIPTGTPVSACAPGKVLLAVSRIVTGNSVVIEHLPGVYSLYYHLDSIAVSEGAMVAAGDLLGLSGATGLATGPHLHWEVRVSGENTDPDALISRAILDPPPAFGSTSYAPQGEGR
jgi:murein DD-endopeptidase MepM/ murein hydrolase activator NlpD